MPMKLVSLNTWGGKYFKPLTDFIKQNQDADIFCFQEVYSTNSEIKQYKNILRANMLEELIKILSNYQYFYSKEISGFDSDPNPVHFNLTVGKAIFIKNGFNIQNKGDLILYGNIEEKELKKDFSNLAVTLQYINVVINNKIYTICNIHGTSFPGSKLDTELRLNYSKRIVDFLKDKDGIKILTGDFNLLPQTKSIKIFEEEMRNLIKEFKIKKTRSNISPFFGKPDFQKFADYTFVSKDIKVKSFQVPDVKISDHLPMILKFE